MEASGLALPRPGPWWQEGSGARARPPWSLDVLPPPWALGPQSLPHHLLPGPEVCLSFHDQNASHRPDNPSGQQPAEWPPMNVSELVSAHGCLRLQGLSPSGPASPRLGGGGRSPRLCTRRVSLQLFVLLTLSMDVMLIFLAEGMCPQEPGRPPNALFFRTRLLLRFVGGGVQSLSHT